MLFYALISNLVPKKVIAFCLVRYCQKNPEMKVVDLFDELTKEMGE
jgi:hypothetical protein